MKIDEDKLALRANAIWGDWAKKAGIKHGDVVTSIDGKSNKMSIKQLQTYLQMNKEWGEVVKLVVIRKRKPKRLTMTLPQENHD
jgi:C-terminal processing protease CtpA/Prc